MHCKIGKMSTTRILLSASKPSYLPRISVLPTKHFAAVASLPTRRFLSTPTKATPPIGQVPCGGLPDVNVTRARLPPAVAELVKKYPSVINIPVQWGEQDTYGHLNNVIYIRYFESGRIAYFDQILKPHLSSEAYLSFFLGRGVGPIAKSVSCKYRAPVMYPDTVTVGVRIDPSSVKRDRFTQSCIMVSHAQERVVAEGECVVVTFDYREQRKAHIPDEVIEAWKIGEGIK